MKIWAFRFTKPDKVQHQDIQKKNTIVEVSLLIEDDGLHIPQSTALGIKKQKGNALSKLSITFLLLIHS